MALLSMRYRSWALTIVRDVPRLSRAALSEPHGLVFMILQYPVSPESGDRKETSKTKDLTEEAAAHTTATDQPAEDRERDDCLVAGGVDCGGDAFTGPDASGRRRP